MITPRWEVAMDGRDSREDSAGNPHPRRAVPLRWFDLHAVDDPPGDQVGDILAKRADGMTVSGVFTADECARAVDALEAWRDERTGAMFGTMLGMPLAELSSVTDDPDDRTPYLESTRRANDRYREAFGFDPATRLASVVERFAGGRLFRAPVEEGRSYNMGNVRWYDPGSRGLPAHAGNEFQMHQSATLAHLQSTTVTIDHLSWFVVIQAPEAGGALSVFDLLYDEHEAAVPTWTEIGRDDADFDDQPALQLAPPAGTLILFGGGWRWHRVDPIHGSVQRVTWGGFAGPSLDGLAVNSWF
jgi:hypothetical protein